MLICSHLLKTFLMKKFMFLHLFEQVNGQKTTVKKKKISFFKKNYVASLFTIFEKVLAICKFLYGSVFRCKV